jgi:uncharacterized membrane protein YbjE (DUF340 family)
MTKTELRRQQMATQRRFILMFILTAFAVGLMVDWVVPREVAYYLLSILLLIMGALVIEGYVRQKIKECKAD